MGIAVNIEPAAGKQIAAAVKIEHKQPTYYNPISTRVQDLDEGPLSDPTKYTASEAAAFNLTLDGALQYGAIKTPAVAAVEAQAAVLYKDAEEYNAAKGTELTDEEFEALDEEAKIKTPAVAAVEAQAAVEYTNEEVDAYNATLPGAKKAGDTKTSSAEVVTES